MKELSTLLLLAVLFLTVPLTARTKESSLVFTHVTVIDVASGQATPDMTVVIEGARITAVGKDGKVKVPRGARTIDALGKYLIPGLWDMHVHLLTDGRYEWAFPLLVANGITGVRDTGSNLPIERIDQVRRQIADGHVGGPRIAWTVRILDGAGTNLPPFITVIDPEEGLRLVRSYKQQGADFIKVHDLLSRDVYLAIADEARRQKIPFVGHPPFSMTAAEVSDLGQKSIEHLKDVLFSASRDEAAFRKRLRTSGLADPNQARSRAEVASIDSYDEGKASALFARFVRNGTWHCPTVVNKLTLAESAQAYGTDNLRYVPKSLQERWNRTWPKAPSAAADAKGKGRYLLKSAELTAAMHRAGVQLLAGTDSPNPSVPGFALHGELELMVEAGLTPLAALQTATINPARFLGRENELGTIEKGKLADLVLLDADPLKDICNTRRISAVVVNGKHLPQETLQRLLADVEVAANRVNPR